MPVPPSVPPPSAEPACVPAKAAPVVIDGALGDAGALRDLAARRLAPHAVEVWFVRGGEPGLFAALLDDAERARADRFVTETLRARFIVAHGVLRTVLAAYAGMPAAALRFAVGVHGKPALAAGGVSFSLSHCADGVAVAVAAAFDVGIDIEQPRPMQNRDGLARRNFSADEQRAFFALAEQHRDDAFFRLWTRKEALVKGLGQGLLHPLAGFSVGLGAPVTLDAPRTPGWSLHHLAPAEGFVGALAVRHDAPLLCGGRLWPGDSVS